MPWFATAKVGLELFAEAGPAAFDALHALGMRVFADLKLHDIPTTVERAATVLGRAGVDTLNFHAAGGVEMLRVGVLGLRAGAEAAGHPAPIALGVTVLTSDPRVEEFGERLQWAKDAGCDGVVCSAHEIALAHAANMRTMVAGIRLPDADVHDQARRNTERCGEGGCRLDGDRARGDRGARPGVGGGIDCRDGRHSDGRRCVPRRIAGALTRPQAPTGPMCMLRARASGQRATHQRARVSPRVLRRSPMPLPPSLSPEERQAALAKAAVARRRRAEVKERLKAGGLTLKELFEQGDGDEILAKLKVVSVLESLPGVGKVKARRLMQELDIAASRRLRGLGDNQRRKLLDRFA